MAQVVRSSIKYKAIKDNKKNSRTAGPPRRNGMGAFVVRLTGAKTSTTKRIFTQKLHDDDSGQASHSRLRYDPGTIYKDAQYLIPMTSR